MSDTVDVGGQSWLHNSNVPCDGFPLSSKFQVTFDLIFILYWNEEKTMAACK